MIPQSKKEPLGGEIWHFWGVHNFLVFEFLVKISIIQFWPKSNLSKPQKVWEEIYQYLVGFGSSSAHRQDGPCVYYTK